LIGHSGSHSVQSMHSSGSITKKFGPSWKASTGQTSTQSVYLHLMQLSVTTKVMGRGSSVVALASMTATCGRLEVADGSACRLRAWLLFLLRRLEGGCPGCRCKSKRHDRPLVPAVPKACGHGWTRLAL